MRYTLALLLTLTFCANPSIAATPTVEAVRERIRQGEPTRIVCFGDSITGAYYHTGGVRAWCDLLGIALERTYPRARLEMINAGISGHTTVQGLARIEADVLAKQPHLVVVMFGMNDVTRHSLDDFAANLKTIVQKCRDAGAAVVLCTPNSVYENPGRPNGKLAELSERVRQVAKDHAVLVADCFADYLARRERDETAWMLLMSDEIHPNLHGHRAFAELIAETISGRRVSLDNVPPLAEALQHTLKRLRSGESIHLVAMPPYDEWMATVIRALYPQAQIRVTVWPVASKSVIDLRNWAQGIRDLKPDLVVSAVPASATTADHGSYIRDYEWVLNWSFPFAGRAWDVVPVLPSVTGPLQESEQPHAQLARQIVLGKDVRFLERTAGDERTAATILSAWIAEQEQTRPDQLSTFPPVKYDEHQDLSYYLDTDRNRHAIQTPDDWQIRRQHILGNLQFVMGRWPGASLRVPLDVRVLDESRTGNVIRRKLSYQSDPYDRVTAWLLVPVSTASQKRPAILALHQTSGGGKDEPVGLAGSPNMHYARELAERGYVVLAPDYPSLGEHDYDFSQHPEYASGSLKAIWDNVRAVDLLTSLAEVDPERIGVIGHSLGGHNALFTAAFEPQLKVIVSSCGFTSLLKDDVPSWNGPRYMPRIASEFGNDVHQMPFDFPEIIAALAPRPFLACAATRDDDFDVTGVRDVIAAVKPIYELLGQPDRLQAEYPEAPHDFPSETRQRAYEFLDRNLQHNAPKN